MSAVRNVGEGVVAHIVAARDEGGPFTDFYDFCDRVDPSVLNKRTIESLIKAGGFDSLGHPRQGLRLRVRDDPRHGASTGAATRPEGQFDLFSSVGDASARAVVGAPGRDPRHRVPQVAAARVREGDARPLRERAPDAGRGAVAAPPRRLHAHRAPRRRARASCASVGGIVTALNRKYTKRGDLMATFVLEDLGAALEVMVFPKTMAQFGHLLDDDAIVW